MWNSFLPWLKGLIAAFVGSTSQTVIEVAGNPAALSSQWKMTLTKAVASGVLAICFYLARSPVPETTKEEK